MSRLEIDIQSYIYHSLNRIAEAIGSHLRVPKFELAEAKQVGPAEIQAHILNTDFSGQFCREGVSAFKLFQP